MDLFIDSLSSPASLLIINKDKKILYKKNIHIALHESSRLIWEISSFLKENHLIYNNIENIIVTNGPGSFTWVRTVVLIANTLAFKSKKQIQPLNYFELFNNYPIIKCSSKRDVFIKKSKQSKIEVMSNEECEEYIQTKNITKIWGDFDKFKKWDIICESTPRYAEIIHNISPKKYPQIEALYIKKPTIS